MIKQDNGYNDISKKLSALISLSLNPRKKSKMNENVDFLLHFSLSNADIAEILGTSKRTIEVIKSKLKVKSKSL